MLGRDPEANKGHSRLVLSTTNRPCRRIFCPVEPALRMEEACGLRVDSLAGAPVSCGDSDASELPAADPKKN